MQSKNKLMVVVWTLNILVTHLAIIYSHKHPVLYEPFVWGFAALMALFLTGANFVGGGIRGLSVLNFGIGFALALSLVPTATVLPAAYLPLVYITGFAFVAGLLAILRMFVRTLAANDSGRTTVVASTSNPRDAASSSSPATAAAAPKDDDLSLEQLLNGVSTPMPHTRIFADSYGRVTWLALMISPYVKDEDRTQMLGGYKTLFTEMEPDTKFLIIYQTDQDKADVGKVISDNNVANPERITFLNPNVGDLTIWARDMMVGMYTPDDAAHTALLHQTTLHSWHANDMLVPAKIAAAFPSIVLDTEPFIVTDGGDVQSNTHQAFAGYYSIVSAEMKIADAIARDAALKARVYAYYQRHFGKQIAEPAAGDLHFPYVKQDRPDGSYQLVRDPAFKREDAGPGKVTLQHALEDLAIRLFEDRFDKPVQVMGREDPTLPGQEMDPATDHMDMGCTPVDDNTSFVGDPSLAKQAIASMSAIEREALEGLLSRRAGHEVKLPVFAPHNRDDQSDFDAYVHILEGLGYQVGRVPHLEPPKPGDPYISFNNCLMERFIKDGREIRRVFLPHYNNAKLDDMADAVWKAHGFEVHPIPLWALSSEWGALRCVSNWLDRWPRG